MWRNGDGTATLCRVSVAHTAESLGLPYTYPFDICCSALSSPERFPREDRKKLRARGRAGAARPSRGIVLFTRCFPTAPLPAGGEAWSERGKRSGDDGAEQQISNGYVYGRAWVSAVSRKAD